MRKKWWTLIAVSLFLAGCSSSNASEDGGDRTIKIGVTGGPPEEITEIVKEEAAKEGIDLEVVKFNDYITPNRALSGEELDLNMFQTKQFLENYIEDRNDPLAMVGTTYNSTYGIYSEKYNSIDEIPEGATLGIINDPVNIGRSLLLYQEVELLQVEDTDGLPKLNDIKENPKKFEFTEIEGPLMLRTLGSIDAGVVASTHAIDQGINPLEEAIYLETGMEFPMVVASREEDKDHPDYKRITELYHSEAVKEFIEERYEGVIVVTDDPFQDE